MIVPVPRGAGDNRGEDLRFPISSSSGFSSPMEGPRRETGSDFLLYARYHDYHLLYNLYTQFPIYRQIGTFDVEWCQTCGSKYPSRWGISNGDPVKITLRHSSGLTKRIKIGFSWTLFFFGLWVPIFRGDFRNLLRIWLLGIVTLSIYYWISCWTYNTRYVKALLEKGYVPADDISKMELIRRNIISDVPIAV